MARTPSLPAAGLTGSTSGWYHGLMEPNADTRDYPYGRLATDFLPLLDEHCRAAGLLADSAPLSSLSEMAKALRIAFLLAYARLADRVPPRVKTVSGWLPLFPDLPVPAALRHVLSVLDTEDPSPTAANTALACSVLPEFLAFIGTLSRYEGKTAGYETPPVLAGVPEAVATEVSEALAALANLPTGGHAYLFGSQATGMAREDSDIDVAIVYPDNLLDEQSVRGRGRVEVHLLRESDLVDPTNLLAQGMLSANIPL